MPYEFYQYEFYLQYQKVKWLCKVWPVCFHNHDHNLLNISKILRANISTHVMLTSEAAFL